MNVTVRKIGNSEGVIIPRDVLDRLGIKAGDRLELAQDNGELRLKVAVADDDDFSRQLTRAQKFMDKYRTALQKLAE